MILEFPHPDLVVVLPRGRPMFMNDRDFRVVVNTLSYPLKPLGQNHFLRIEKGLRIHFPASGIIFGLDHEERS